MKKLLTFIIKEITQSDDFKIEEVADGDKVDLLVYLPKETIGLVIGRGGSTIKSIRNLIRVKATLDKKVVFIKIEEKE